MKCKICKIKLLPNNRIKGMCRKCYSRENYRVYSQKPEAKAHKKAYQKTYFVKWIKEHPEKYRENHRRATIRKAKPKVIVRLNLWQKRYPELNIRFKICPFPSTQI